MTDRRLFLGAAIAIVGLPAAIVPLQAVSFYSANRDNGSFVSSGERREYLLYVPQRYDRTRPTPLVISMHGAGLWSASQRDISRWNDLADAKGFIVVYPSGVGGKGVRIWRAEPGDDLTKDVKFIAALIDTISAHYNIDSTRIYANGLSNGGGMSFALSCTLADRIAAIGVVAGAQTLPWRLCSDQRPMPMIAFHGTADTHVPYMGGSSWLSPRPWPSVPKWTANWARRNHCEGEPHDSSIAADVNRRTYTHCADSRSVVLYTVRGGGHTWPGGMELPQWFVGRTTRSIDATRLMWDFFSSHQLGSSSALIAVRSSIAR
ncbi:MAG TPA: PHB depolymerase family esterase [Gemmatimonadaceae bacterium]|nr:PHB depolymerase family esterase [Gemmatimonadaceae bacterium]